MNMQYFFSHGTPEAEALKENSPEGRVAILQATPVYEDAVQENKRKVKEALNLSLINAILKTNHPRAQALYDFVTSNGENREFCFKNHDDFVTASRENQEWYFENHENIKLVPDGIEILGDIFCLEDEKSLDGEWIWNKDGKTYFHFDSAQEYAKGQGKRIPKDWSKYIDFLPGNNANKVKFLVNVLGLSSGGYSYWNRSYYYEPIYFAHYFSSDSNVLVFNVCSYSYNSGFFYIDPVRNSSICYSIRCLKN